MRTYYADIEDRMRGNDFIYTMYADSDEEAIIKFKRVYGNRVEMISLVGNHSKICIYEKPELFGKSKAEKLISYKDLLKAYIVHVIWESTSHHINDHIINNKNSSECLSERQYEEMKALVAELEVEGKL